ncbi:ABC transporter substrate-binding protein [Paenibacillus arenilitoris]|uniref:Extracellular solute-binding protein n=1 Tax=Paenibacillus arenilitoris TaxID=2772299 RepID=A0A927CUD7_9BACL|nr:extracellular solute-binding protein [Paenibacillus arenilitoris]MBD2872391.1 extracellular solute-binding protein [Paenibacillus arenilitoris]
MFLLLNRALLLLLIVMLLASCTNSEEKELLELDTPIRIAYFSEQNFKNRYASLIENDAKFSNLTYEIVPTSELIKGTIDIDEWMKGNNFDIIYAPGLQLEQFVERDKLVHLDSPAWKSDLSMESFDKTAIELSKLYGKGEVYGIPPGVEGRSIIFNKKIFDQYKIPYPDDYLTWNEFIDLAMQFQGFGLTVPMESGFELIWEIGQTNNLSIYRANPLSISYNTEPWSKIWERVHMALTTDVIKTGDYFLSTFLEGNTAMSLITNRQYIELSRKNPTFDWGIVTAPVAEDGNRATKQMYADGFYAISATSPHHDAAKEWLNFLMSGKSIELDRLSGHYGADTKHSSHTNPFKEALFKLKPQKKEMLPYEYLQIGEEGLQRLLTESVSTEEVLNSIQAKASELAKE